MRRTNHEVQPDYQDVLTSNFPTTVTFFNQKLPCSFVINYKGRSEPNDGQKIGYCSVTNQNLFWENGSVVARNGK